MRLNYILRKIHKNSRSWKKNPLTTKIVFKVIIRINPRSLIPRRHFSHQLEKINFGGLFERMRVGTCINKNRRMKFAFRNK